MPAIRASTIEECEFIFRREKEISELKDRLAARKSFVLHGPAAPERRSCFAA